MCFYSFFCCFMLKVPKVDQPDDIALQIRELAMEYITPKNAIILAVSVANDDFENSDSIQIARDVDPNGERTLAVLTKLDMAKDHTKCMQMLKGLVVSVKLGIIGVINRSDADIKRGKSFKDVVEQEEKFLMLKCPGIATKHGTKFLAHQINRLLLTRIQRCFPTVDVCVFFTNVNELSDKKLFQKKLIIYRNVTAGLVKNIDLLVAC